jgi:acyl carrier protein
MDRSAFYLEVEELLELPRGSLAGDQPLKELEEWDSLANISFIALADSTYGVILQPKKIEACLTVGDLANLIEESQGAGRQSEKPARQ